MLPLKKIYVDSRHKTPDSISDSNLRLSHPIPCSYLTTASSS